MVPAAFVFVLRGLFLTKEWNRVKFVLAPDSFKGTMDATEVCAIWAGAVEMHFPGAQVVEIPMADGGEGMVEACLRAAPEGGERRSARVCGPMGAPVEAAFGWMRDGSAVMEMAACAGLPMMEGRLDPLHATTRGVGEMLLHAEGLGARRVLMGIGGSATNDGGIGMAAALGYRFLDASGAGLEPLAENLGRIARIQRPERLPDLEIVVACDVDNPLCGPEGATRVFGPQKGVRGETLDALDAGLENLASVMKRDLGANVRDLPGAGAAGGLGAGLVAFLGGRLCAGVEVLLDAAHFDEAASGASLVITGEGRIDGQSVRGKVPVGVARRARRQGVPCIALCGSIGDGVEAVYEEGIDAVFSAVRGAADFASIRESCREDMRLLADAALRLWRVKAMKG